MLPGLASLGCWLSWHVEHLRSSAACAISARYPCALRRVLKRSPLGWPKFLWALNKAICSSLGKAWNRTDCFALFKSAAWELDIPWGDSTVVRSWDLVWESVSFISDPLGILEFSGTLVLVPDGEELGLLGASALLDGCPGCLVSLANMVKLILVAWDGRIKFLLANSSHGSQPSSARSSPDPLSVKTLRRNGAIPFKRCSGGAKVRLAPRQATIVTTVLSGINCCTKLRISGSSIHLLPTRGMRIWILSKMVFHMATWSTGVVLTLHFWRFPQGNFEISSVRLSLADAYRVNLAFFGGEASACSAAASTGQTSLLYGCSNGLWTLPKIVAIFRANFLG